jgi:hypothetical protein
MTLPHVIEELYQGEVLGEGLFNRMLRDLDDDRQRHVVGSLLQLETETKALLRQAAASRGLSVMEDDTQRAAGEEVGASLQAMRWRDKMTRLQAGIGGRYLPRFELLARRATPEDAPVTSFMVRHEAALLDVVTREAAGDTASSLEPLRRMLRWPLPPPSSDPLGPT